MSIKLLVGHLKNLSANPFFAGSVVMIVGTNLHNFGQLVYHFMAGRLLGTVYYGELAAIISLFALLAIIQQSFGLTIIKFVASSKNAEDANNLARWVWFWSFWLALLIAVVLFLFAPLLAEFLHISQLHVMYLFAPVIFLAFMANSGRALLQGFIKFPQHVLSMTAEVVVKIAFTLVFLLLGYALFGAMVGLGLGVLAGVLTAWWSLRSNISGRRGVIPAVSPFVKYSIPVFVQGIALTSMYSSDVILVKHFFSGEEAGIYAALAKLGTIALFGASPITNVMFPLVSKRHSHGQPYHKIFYLSILLVSLISLSVVVVYGLSPSLIVGGLFGESFVRGASILWWFSLYMLLLGMAMLFTQFYLSVGKTRVVWLFAAAAIAQVVLILTFHDALLTVVQVSIIAAALLVICLLIYFPYHHKRDEE